MSENPVERAILIYEGINRKKVFSIKPLGGGTANDVFLVNLEDVIRLNKPNKVDSSYFSSLTSRTSSGLINLTRWIPLIIPRKGNMKLPLPC